jgi:hypothetical protein
MTSDGFFEHSIRTRPSSSAISSRSGAPMSHATTPTTPHLSNAASTASSYSKTAIATGSSTSSGTRKPQTNQSRSSTCPSNPRHGS